MGKRAFRKKRKDYEKKASDAIKAQKRSILDLFKPWFTKADYGRHHCHQCKGAATPLCIKKQHIGFCPVCGIACEWVSGCWKCKKKGKQMLNKPPK